MSRDVLIGSDAGSFGDEIMTEDQQQIDRASSSLDREMFGDYVIQKSLGYGSFGEVYLAEHRFIKRPFVLKILPPHLCSDSGFIRRFEAKVADIASLDHPHIVKIHNVSQDEGSYFLVLDPIVDSFGDTMHLDRYLSLKGASLSETDIEQLLLQIASALDYAHDAGVIHGSLKLTNVLVVASEDGVKVLLSDFGLHRLLGEGLSFLRLCELASKVLMSRAPSSSERAHDISRSFLKNFSFLAPEQKAFHEHETDMKVDSYSFGVLAYFLLTKKIPEALFESPFQLAPHLQKNWDLLVHRCLQYNPHARPQRLLQAMHEYLAAPRSKDLPSSAEGEQSPESIFQLSFEFPREGDLTKPLPSIDTPKPLLKPQEISRPEYEPDPGAIFQRDTLVSHYEPKKTEFQQIEPILTDMVIIRGGSYFRGSNEGSRDEMPRHSISLPNFALDVHPVTNEQFVRFLQAMGGEKDGNNNDIIRLKDSRIKRSCGKLVIESGYNKHPVVGVTWYGAVAYAKWIGKRLPTEAEWEIGATSARENSLYPTGSEIEKVHANFFSSDTTPVLSYPPTPLGLYDMAGNVYEWCQDWYAYNYYDASLVEPDSPKGPPQGVYRVLRGGCWKSLKDDLRCAHRHRNNPGAVNGTYGFRCAADAV
ncbi:MAG: bifunctional serine/threonine-protein kinase/formylglycine-generating enzyme family protein [Chlamydiales bacterium]|nr:bifunctional serine/threonine-protein kinase/formylglycine-generating enzyme family protein [Chlamydiales bacterium]